MMSAALSRIVTLLRSRKLAVTLIALVALYGILGTLVPRGTPQSAVVAEWAAAHPVAASVAEPLGMYRAFTSPAFLALAVLLAASTTACAFERTRRALRLSRSLRARPSDALIERLAKRPEASIPVSSDLDADTLMDSVRERLGKRGLNVSIHDGLASGRAGLAGLAGSPLFHWSLVLLMFVTAAGQATRAEGFLGLPLGERVADVHESYLQIVEGPFFSENHSGVVLEMSEMNRDFVKDGTDYGPSPYIRAYRDSVLVQEGWVHPNSPLRVGALMIHMAAFGPAATLSVESTGGAEIARTTFTLDLSTDTSSGTVPQVFDLTTAQGQAGLTARIQVLTKAAAGASPTEARALIETKTVEAAEFGPPVTVPVDSTIDLPGGGRLRVVSVTDWARVSVANDWSVPFIYVLLMLAILGLAVAVLVPARRVSVLLVETDEGRFLNIGTWHDKRDPTFKKQMIDAVELAAGAQEAQ